MIENITSVLQNKVEGLMYYSEYEYPITVCETDIKNAGDIPAYIASKIADTNIEDLKSISHEQFFARFQNYLSYGGEDELMNENARQFLSLYEFLKTNFEKIFVYRVEKPGEALIPVFIIVQAKESQFISLETTAVET